LTAEPQKQTREVSRFWLALAFLIGTLIAAFMKAPDWFLAMLGTCTTNIAAFYFGEKGKRTTPAIE
jgi:1,4-dihydroxy-2-naphthoate octaprenyltransferase